MSRANMCFMRQTESERNYIINMMTSKERDDLLTPTLHLPLIIYRCLLIRRKLIICKRKMYRGWSTRLYILADNKGQSSIYHIANDICSNNRQLQAPTTNISLSVPHQDETSILYYLYVDRSIQAIDDKKTLAPGKNQSRNSETGTGTK
jgi:hypothetical protein